MLSDVSVKEADLHVSVFTLLYNGFLKLQHHLLVEFIIAGIGEETCDL